MMAHGAHGQAAYHGKVPFLRTILTSPNPQMSGSWESHAIQPKGGRRLRVGDYRVVFIIKGDVVTTVKIGDRQEIYK